MVVSKHLTHFCYPIRLVFSDINVVPARADFLHIYLTNYRNIFSSMLNIS